MDSESDDVTYRTTLNPYSNLKNARFLPYTPPTSSIETNHPTISLDISDFPRLMKTKSPGELAYKIKCTLGGNWKACDARAVTMDICLETSENEFDEMFVIDSIVAGKKELLIEHQGTVSFELRFLETSNNYGDSNFNLKFSVEDVARRALLVKKSPPFYVYSHSRMISTRTNVEIRTMCPNQLSLLDGGELHLIGRTFFKGSRLKIYLKIGDLYTEVKSYNFYSKTVIFVQIPPCPVDYDEECNRVKAGVMISNDGITHSNIMTLYYIR